VALLPLKLTLTLHQAGKMDGVCEPAAVLQA